MLAVVFPLSQIYPPLLGPGSESCGMLCVCVQSALLHLHPLHDRTGCHGPTPCICSLGAGAGLIWGVKCARIGFLCWAMSCAQQAGRAAEPVCSCCVFFPLVTLAWAPVGRSQIVADAATISMGRCVHPMCGDYDLVPVCTPPMAHPWYVLSMPPA